MQHERFPIVKVKQARDVLFRPHLQSEYFADDLLPLHRFVQQFGAWLLLPLPSALQVHRL